MRLETELALVRSLLHEKILCFEAVNHQSFSGLFFVFPSDLEGDINMDPTISVAS